MEVFYRKYIKEDIPSHYLTIDSPGEGKIRGILVGHDSTSVYIRRRDLRVMRFDKVDVIGLGERKLHELTIFASMHARAAKLQFTKFGSYHVRPVKPEWFTPRLPDASPPEFYVADVDSSREVNRLVHFKASDDEYPELITMFVRIGTSKQIVAWFADELEVIKKAVERPL